MKVDGININSLLIIQIVWKCKHFGSIMFCNLPPLRLSAIFRHLFKGIEEPRIVLSKKLQFKNGETLSSKINS